MSPLNISAHAYTRSSAPLRMLPSNRLIRTFTRAAAYHCRLCILVAFFFLSSDAAYAQHHLSFDRITQREGLSDPSVMVIRQDVCGAMWFGTTEGVERYDGYGFRTFKIGEVRDMCADDRGYVWIACKEVGLFCYDITNDTLLSYAPGVDEPDRQNRRWVSCLFLDRVGILWIGTMAGAGVLRFDTIKRKYLGPLETPLTEDGPNSILPDSVGNLWFGTQSGVVKYNTDSGQATFYKHAINSFTVNIHVAIGRDGKIWVNGGHREGLLRLDTASQEWHKMLLRGKAVFASSVMLDDAGRVWVPTSTDGLKIYDPASDTWEEYHHRSSDPRSLTSDRILAVYRDKDGNLWLGTRNGVSKIPRWRKKFWSIPHNTDDPNSPPNAPIRSICEDRVGNLWIASFGDGVKMWNRRAGIFKKITGIPNYVHVVHSDSSGRVWIATSSPYYLVAIIPETSRRRIFKYSATDTLSIPKGPILSLSDDVDGSLCIGTGNGDIAYLDPRSEKCMRLARPNPDMQGWVTRCLWLDRTGTLWSSFGGILLEVSRNPRRAHLVQSQGHLKDWEWVITAMYEDQVGRFWIGTIAGFGLLDRNDGRLTYLRRDDRPYQSAATYGILGDGHGDLWLMTTKGVTRFGPETKEFTDFGIADGYPPTNISSNAFYGTSSYCRTKDGFLVFGTGEGIVLFHPDSLHENPNPPNVILTDLKVTGASTRLRMNMLSERRMFEYRPLEVRHNQNSVEFNYAALDYTAPLHNTYMYKLEGLEENWSPASNERRVAYANLSPGNYIFRVKAANNDGVWNEQGVFVRITILPAWWMTWWFRTLAALALVGVIVLIVQLRIRRAVTQERFRLRIASDLHDDIGSSLSSIALVSDNVQRSLDKAHPGQRQLQAVSTVAREVADRLKDDVWIIEPGDDSLESLLLRMKDASKQILGEFPYSFQSEIQEARRKLDMEFRKNVLLIHKEALHNVLKHAEATQANVSVQVRGDTLRLEIADDGRGFEPDSPRAGHGLVNMRRRAAALKGDLQIDSSPGRGARVKLTVRIP